MALIWLFAHIVFLKENKQQNIIDISLNVITLK